jgi:hypothetical protein
VEVRGDIAEAKDKKTTVERKRSLLAPETEHASWLLSRDEDYFADYAKLPMLGGACDDSNPSPEIRGVGLLIFKLDPTPAWRI